MYSMHLKELKDNFSMRLQDVIFDCRDWTLKSRAQVQQGEGQSWYSMNPSKNM